MRRNAAISGIIRNDLKTARAPLPKRHIDVTYFECAPSRSRERSADRCGDRKCKPWSRSHPCPIFKCCEERVRLLRSDPNESYPRGASRASPRPRLPVSVSGGKGLRTEQRNRKLHRAFGPANPESTVISWPATIFTGRRVTDVRMQLAHLAKISIAMRAHKGRTKTIIASPERNRTVYFDRGGTRGDAANCLCASDHAKNKIASQAIKLK